MTLELYKFFISNIPVYELAVKSLTMDKILQIA